MGSGEGWTRRISFLFCEQTATGASAACRSYPLARGCQKRTPLSLGEPYRHCRSHGVCTSRRLQIGLWRLQMFTTLMISSTRAYTARSSKSRSARRYRTRGGALAYGSDATAAAVLRMMKGMTMYACDLSFISIPFFFAAQHIAGVRSNRPIEHGDLLCLPLSLSMSQINRVDGSSLRLEERRYTERRV